MWIVGQRVLAEFEPELGLGIIVDVSGRRLVEVLFPGAEVARRYAQQGAPLRRLVLAPGQRAKSKKGETFTITEVRENGGLFLYVGDGIEVWEYELDHVIEDDSPVARCLAGRWSPPRTFQLRERAWRLRSRSLDPDIKGLVGPKVQLLPHQLYIAHEISKREFPRVLLADEVGLGKTIEAGLIFSSLKALGRANRVLVLVPESLKHQWLAEMYRRFSEMFSVIDEERSEAEAESQGVSAFQANQKVICSIDFLLDNPERLEEAVDADPWDLVIVDEAHHLEWNDEDASPEWEVARLMASRTRGLLLLTATPENRGMDTEFGLLHLVDPDRFPELKKFRESAKKMHDVAMLAKKVAAGDRKKSFLDTLEEAFPGDADLASAVADYAKGGPGDALIARLIDRHGTGRVLMRNRRSRLKGFPERKFHPHPIACPELWLDHLASLTPASLEDDRALALAAARSRVPLGDAGKAWFQARAAWLAEFLKSLENEKALLICASAKRAIDLQARLREVSAIRTALFHEGLEIVERDRQAAWFQQADGAQVLLCSEIGGEGRNFQFAHHLVLFDLPLHPDVLEQRIGRLDRIGQKSVIHIHAPYFEDTPEEVILRWYDEGIDSFTSPWNGGDAADPLMPEVADTIRGFLPKSKGYAKRASKLKKLLKDSSEKATEIRERLRESVDILIDLNSFDEAKGKALATRLHEVDGCSELRDFMDEAFNHFGVEAEEMDHEGTLKIVAHSLTFVESFPGLGASGESLVTYDRDHALEREEIGFLSWDSPLAQGALSLVLEGDTGRVSAGLWKGMGRGEPLLVELLYVLQATAPAYLEVERDLPLYPLKRFVTLSGVLASAPAGLDTAQLTPLTPEKFVGAMGILREKLPDAIERASQALAKETKAIVEAAIVKRRARLGAENERMRQLARVNRLISKQEIERHAEKIEQGVEAIRAATARLDALRLVVKDAT